MSRSKHTRPIKILAADRVKAPHEGRGKDDASSFRRVARLLKEAGIVLDGATGDPTDESVAALPPNGESRAKPVSELIIPRITVARSRSGCFHPASKAAIVQLLQFFGESCFYGLREIRLAQSNSAHAGKIVLGQLQVPGTIVLYDLSVPPWTLPGVLPPAELAQLQQAGAKISVHNQVQTLVEWTQDALKNFVLFDGLMHEVGHHLIQQYTGKRSARVARTKDHERIAENFATRCREEFLAFVSESEVNPHV